MKSNRPRLWAVVHTKTQTVAYGETTKGKAEKLAQEGFEVVKVDKPVPENVCQLWTDKNPVHLMTLCHNPFSVSAGF